MSTPYGARRAPPSPLTWLPLNSRPSRWSKSRWAYSNGSVAVVRETRVGNAMVGSFRLHYTCVFEVMSDASTKSKVVPRGPALPARENSRKIRHLRTAGLTAGFGGLLQF